MTTKTKKSKKRSLPISVCNIVEAEDLALERGSHDRLAATPEEEHAAQIEAMFKIMSIESTDENKRRRRAGSSGLRGQIGKTSQTKRSQDS